MKINSFFIVSTLVMSFVQVESVSAQSKNKSGFRGSLIETKKIDGKDVATVFYEPLMQEKLLVANPANSDEAMAFVVCKNSPVAAEAGAYWKNANCKIQSSPPKAKPCSFTDSKKPLSLNGRGIDLKPEYTSNIEKYAKTEIDQMPPGPVNDLSIAYVSCTMESKDERRPLCVLSEKPPKYINCSEEDADTDTSKPRRAVPPSEKKKGGS